MIGSISSLTRWPSSSGARRRSSAASSDEQPPSPHRGTIQQLVSCAAHHAPKTSKPETLNVIASACSASIDWNEVTALATAALALLTFVLAGAAIIAAKYARQAIAADLKTAREATEAAQRMTRLQIESTHRPLLIDVTETTSKPSDLDPSATPSLKFPGGNEVVRDWRQVYLDAFQYQLDVAVPLRNVGTGPAVIEKDGIRVFGGGVEAEEVDSAVHRERVPPGETTRILCACRFPASRSIPDAVPDTVRMVVPYCDFSGAQATIANVLIERVEEEHWQVTSVTPVAPENDW